MLLDETIWFPKSIQFDQKQYPLHYNRRSEWNCFMFSFQMTFWERSLQLVNASYSRRWVILNRFRRVSSQSCTLPGVLLHELQFTCHPNIKFLMLLIDLFIWQCLSLMCTGLLDNTIWSCYSMFYFFIFIFFWRWGGGIVFSLRGDSDGNRQNFMKRGNMLKYLALGVFRSSFSFFGLK